MSTSNVLLSAIFPTGDTPNDEDWWEHEKDETEVSKKNIHVDKDDEIIANHNNFDNQEGVEIKREGNDKKRLKFRNVGLENWEKSRNRWRVGVVNEDSVGKKREIKQSDRVRIRKGLKQVQRTFEMPVKLSLPDVINIYQDIWYNDTD